MWWFFHFLREYWCPFRGTTHQKRRCCAFQQSCQPSLSTVPQLRRVARQHLVPKHIGLFVTPGSRGLQETSSLRRLDVRLSGECATSELSGRCVGVLTALPDPTKRQAGLNHGVMLRPRTPPVMLHRRGRPHAFFYCACHFLLGLYPSKKQCFSVPFCHHLQQFCPR